MHIEKPLFRKNRALREKLFLKKTLRVSYYEFDALNRVVETKNALGYTISQEYDEVENLTVVTDSQNASTYFTYDASVELLA